MSTAVFQPFRDFEARTNQRRKIAFPIFAMAFIKMKNYSQNFVQKMIFVVVAISIGLVNAQVTIPTSPPSLQNSPVPTAAPNSTTTLTSLNIGLISGVVILFCCLMVTCYLYCRTPAPPKQGYSQV